MDIVKWIVELVFLGIPAWVAAWYYWKQVQLMRRPQQQQELFQAAQKWYQRQWPFLLMAVLLVANWVPHFLAKPVAFAQIGHCKV
ncbi:MAG TPA: hypothetical protein VKE71_04715, partial [Candidatus Angelobacter sp.]|nr:hypothetical protein [Candidatus Angelobacter sp.]